MPPALYNCKTGEFYSSKEEMLAERKERDNVGQKIRYWRKKYKYDLSKNDYEEFNKHVSFIKHIYKIHDFVCAFDPNNVDREHLDIYAQYHKHIKNVLPIQDYLRTLKKIVE